MHLQNKTSHHPLLTTKNAAQISSAVSRTSFARGARGAALPSESQDECHRTTGAGLAACDSRVASALVVGPVD